MAIIPPLANVDVTTQTFGIWVEQSNKMLDALSTEVITANSTFANTGTPAAQRNARLYGSFAANTLIAETALRGGTTSTAANLNITSNTVFTGAAVNVASNTTFTANIAATGANVFINGTQLDITSNVVATARVVTVTSNTQSFKSNSSITAISIVGNSTATNTAIGGTDLNTTSNAVFSANVSVTGALFTSTANIVSTATSQQFKSNSSITAVAIVSNGTSTNTSIGGDNFNVAANVVLTGASHTIAGNVNFDAGSVFVDASNNRLGVGTTTPDATLAVAGTANVSGNCRVGGTLIVNGAVNIANTVAAGNTTVTGSVTATTANVTGNAAIGGATTFNTDYVIDVSANADIGTSASPRVIYSFPKATYRTGKLMVQASKTGNNQIAEMVIAHNGTDAYLTVYGVVASPPASGGANTSAPLGTFTAAVNGANVDISMNQLLNNSAVKIVAHLIK